MKNFIFVIAAVMLSATTKGQDIRALSASEIIHYTSSKDTLYIINFWATWCAPCVGELSEFNALKKHYANDPVKVLLVSLDFKEDYPYKLSQFISRKHLAPEVAWLSDTDPNVFIPKIDNSWQGSIPATVIVAPGKQFKHFIEGTITEKEIRRIADKILDELSPNEQGEFK